jgi:hypothetical protein
MKGSKAIFAVAAFVIAATAAASLFPHRLYGKRIAGQVVDAATGQPIAGAHVASIWRSGTIPRGFTGHNSRDICYHAAATTTNSDGQFEILPWTKWSTYDVYQGDPTVLVYALNYEPAQKTTRSAPDSQSTKHVNEILALMRFSGTVDQRLDVLYFGLANQGCDYGGESQKSLYPMLRAIYEEARGVARSTAQINSLNAFALQMAYAALAFDPNGPSRDAEVKAFIQEHLR